jgi:hypothetical protein
VRFVRSLAGFISITSLPPTQFMKGTTDQGSCPLRGVREGGPLEYNCGFQARNALSKAEFNHGGRIVERRERMLNCHVPLSRQVAERKIRYRYNPRAFSCSNLVFDVLAPLVCTLGDTVALPFSSKAKSTFQPKGRKCQ